MDTVLSETSAVVARGNRIDVLRVLLTVGIVCLHATTNNLQPIVWICSVCVPSFFALSGYLFFWNAPQKPEWRWFRGKIRSRIFTLLIPYLIAVVIAWLCYYFAIKAAPSMVDGFLGDRWKDPLFVFWTGPINLSLWFIRELMVVVVLSPLIYMIIRYTRWWGVLALGVWWAMGKYGGFPYGGPEPLFLFAAGGCLGFHKIASVERWLHTGSRIPVSARPWTFFIYLYHYLLLVGVKKGIARLIPFQGDWASIAVWFFSVVLVLTALTAVYALGRRFLPRVTGILVGGK